MRNKEERNFIGSSIVSSNIIKFILATFITLFSSALFSSTAFITYASTEQVEMNGENNDKFKSTETNINAYFLFNQHIMEAIGSTYKNKEEMNKDKKFVELEVMCKTLLGFKDGLLVALKKVETSSENYRIEHLRKFFQIASDFKEMRKIFESLVRAFADIRLTRRLRIFMRKAFKFYDNYFSNFVEALKTDLKR